MSEYIVLQVSSFHGFDMECLLVFPAEFLFTSAYKGLFVNKEHPPTEMPACVSYYQSGILLSAFCVVNP